MVLFMFVVMMLTLGQRATEMEHALFSRGAWSGPLALAAILIAEVGYLAIRATTGAQASSFVDSKQVALALYGPYVLGAELASMLLLAGLVGAYHLGWRKRVEEKRSDVVNTDRRRSDPGRDSVRAGDGRFARTP
jgi:NADH-quinone oxidoreductase subunit J